LPGRGQVLVFMGGSRVCSLADYVYIDGVFGSVIPRRLNIDVFIWAAFSVATALVNKTWGITILGGDFDSGSRLSSDLHPTDVHKNEAHVKKLQDK